MEVLDFERYKTTVHSALLSKIDLEKLASVDSSKARLAVAAIIQEIVHAERVPLNAAEKEDIESNLLDEVFGLGPLLSPCSGTPPFRTSSSTTPTPFTPSAKGGCRRLQRAFAMTVT